MLKIIILQQRILMYSSIFISIQIYSNVFKMQNNFKFIQNLNNYSIPANKYQHKPMNARKHYCTSTNTNCHLLTPIDVNTGQCPSINTNTRQHTRIHGNKRVFNTNKRIYTSIKVNKCLYLSINAYKRRYTSINTNSHFLWLKNFSVKNCKVCFCTDIVRTKTFFHSSSEKSLALHGGEIAPKSQFSNGKNLQNKFSI